MFEPSRCVRALAVFFLAVTALTGCVTTKPMSETEFPHADWDVIINATQQEIATETSSTNPMAAGGGLLGVLIVHAIDSTKNRRAEDAVTGLRDKLIEFDVADEYSMMIIESGVPERLSRLEPLVNREPWDYKTRPLERHVVTLDPGVVFTNDLSALVVELVATEYEADDQGRPNATGFSQIYRYVYPLSEPENGANREDYANVWLTHDTSELEQLILQGMDTTIEMLEFHIEERALEVSEPQFRVKDYGTAVLREWHRRDGLVWLAREDDAKLALAVDERLLLAKP